MTVNPNETKIRAGNVELTRDPEVIYFADKAEVAKNIAELRGVYFGKTNDVTIGDPLHKPTVTIK